MASVELIRSGAPYYQLHDADAKQENRLTTVVNPIISSPISESRSLEHRSITILTDIPEEEVSLLMPPGTPGPLHLLQEQEEPDIQEISLNCSIKKIMFLTCIITLSHFVTLGFGIMIGANIPRS